MNVEAPQQSPPLSSCETQASQSSQDHSNDFFGGPHRPWRRLLARTVDFAIPAQIWFLPLLFALYQVNPVQVDGFMQTMKDYPRLGGVVICLIWVPVEALLISAFGSTPGKWLFAIKVMHQNSNLLSLKEAIYRSFLVFAMGAGFCIPGVSIVTQLQGYRQLTKTGTTTWDRYSGAVVTHKNLGLLRMIVCTIVVIRVWSDFLVD